eukprot:TRINITY_DN4749_c0_g1_i1.p1 TRINITY_DN4749_c0_g1~~TRINITY_DN4749_c0_g1_i1.p1  ORF type:complete len:138 (-),score=12.02 TRINITY_DN4749_c0_g1_i1:387-800(-)
MAQPPWAGSAMPNLQCPVALTHQQQQQVRTGTQPGQQSQPFDMLPPPDRLPAPSRAQSSSPYQYGHHSHYVQAAAFDNATPQRPSSTVPMYDTNYQTPTVWNASSGDGTTSGTFPATPVAATKGSDAGGNSIKNCRE